MAWRLAKSLETLRSQINAKYPDRDKSSDGTVGDTAHSARESDHNPTKAGFVLALDITHDPKSGCDAGKIADALRVSRDPRTKYIISNSRIASDIDDWDWRKYNGKNKHTKHFHISVKPEKAAYDSTAPWKALGVTKTEPARTLPRPPDDPGVETKPKEPGDTKPHAAEKGTPRTGISQGAKIGGGLGLAGLASQIWDAVTQAPETILQALIGAASKPAFWVFVGIIGATGYVWWRRSQMKKADS